MPKTGLGKEYIYGWVVLDSSGTFPVPEEVFSDYQFSDTESLVVLGGGSGPRGMSICRLQALKDSSLGVILERYPDLLSTSYAILIEGRTRFYGRLPWLGTSRLAPTHEQLVAFGIEPGSRLLAVRGSGLTVVFLFDGPQVEAARELDDLPVWK